MKQFAVLIFLFAASVMSAQQALSAEAFRKLTTTAQRFAFLADSNVAKMDKPAYDAILPVIEAKKDEFRTYLEKTGVVDQLTRVLVSLYEEQDKPSVLWPSTGPS